MYVLRDLTGVSVSPFSCGEAALDRGAGDLPEEDTVH